MLFLCGLGGNESQRANDDEAGRQGPLARECLRRGDVIGGERLRAGDIGRRSHETASRLPINMQSSSAISAGFGSFSISSVLATLSSRRPALCGSVEVSVARSRTRAPDLTGAMNRTLSSP